MRRRDMLRAIGAAAAATALAPEHALARTALEPRGTAGRLKHSVSRWCYGRIPLDDLCKAAKDIGYSAIDLLDEKDWETPKKYGLACAMANGFGSIPVGFNTLANHDKLVADATAMIPRV